MPSSDYTPAVADVALFLRTRTRNQYGVELGTFTTETRPTAAEVSAIIADSVVNLEDDLGVDIDPRLWASAKRIVALRAAMAVEVSYFSEQVARDRSVYPQLKEWYEEDLDKLNIAIVETAEGGEPGSDAGEDTPVWGGGDYPFIPSDSFPSGVDLSQGSSWPDAIHSIRGETSSEEHQQSQVLGTTSDGAAVSPSPGTIASYLRRIRDLLSNPLHVIVDSGGGGGGGGVGLTDAELRAAAVPVIGPVTDAQLRAAPIPVSSSALTDAQLRAAPIPVDPGAGPFPVSVAALPLPSGSATEATLSSIATASGSPGDAAWVSGNGSVIALLKKIASSGAAAGLTDTQLRASPVPVDTGVVHVIIDSGGGGGGGGLTNTELRASAVPVSVASLPLPSGAATEATSASILTGIGAPSDAAATTTGSLIAQARRIANLLAGTLTVGGTVAISGSVAVTGPLTDTQLRASAVPVSATSLPLPTGAATETTVALSATALGAPGDAAAVTTGSVIAQLRRVANLLAGTLTVSGTVAVSGSVAVTGTFWQATQPVSGTFWQATQPISAASLPLPSGAALDATLTGGTQKAINRGGAKGATAAADVTSTASGADHQPLDVALYDNAGARMGTSSTPLRTDTTGATTQPVSATSLPLPAGAATETTLAAANTVLGATADAASSTTGTINAHLRSIAAALAGTLTASISGSVAVTGTFWQATQPVSLASQPLPTGASTETSLAALLATAGATSDAAGTGAVSMNAHLRSIATALAGTLTVTGGGGGVQFAEDAVHTTGDLGTMALAVRKDTATALATTDGDYIPLIVDATGKLHVNPGTVAVTGTFFQGTQPISAASLPLPTGASTETTLASVLSILGATGDAASSTTGTVNAHLRSIAAALAGTLTASITGSVAVTGTFWQATQPVSGTFWQATQPVSAASLPLPTGASTETTLAAVNTAVGATGDAASSTTGTLNSHLRSIAANIAAALTDIITGDAGQTAGVTVGARKEVSFSTTIVAAVASTDISNHSWVSVHIVTQGGSSTITFQGSNDNTNWVTVPLQNAGGTTAAIAGSTTAAGIVFAGPVPYRYFRLNVTGIVSGTTAGVVEFSANPKAYQGAASIATPADAANASFSQSAFAFLGGWNGTTWDRLRSTIANGLAVDVTRVTGNVAITAASLPLPTGASTETTLASTLTTLGGTADAAATGTGSINAHLRSIAAYLTGTLAVSLAANQSVNQAQVAGTTTATGSGVAGAGVQRVILASDQTLTTPLGIQNQAATSGGWTTAKLISAATTNATNLKGSAGHVGGWYIFNANAATRYVKLYNKATAPTVGTDTPVWVIAVPAGGAANMEFTNGLVFGTGISYATTTGMADTDNTAVALNDLAINLAYK